MRWLTLYLRSRRVPLALTVTVGATVSMWALWVTFSDDTDAGVQMVILTVLLLVTGLTATLGGPDDDFESTGGLPWPPRRFLHLLAAFAVVAGLLLATLATGARFGPAWLVVRDAAGLLGLTALGAATLGTPKAWFVPLGWTLGATLFPQSEPLLGRVLTWQAQPPADTAAAVTATVFALAGLAAYALAGPAARAPAEAGQQ